MRVFVYGSAFDAETAGFGAHDVASAKVVQIVEQCPSSDKLRQIGSI